MNNVVATTILEQLGGNKFRAMTGAKNFVSGADYLQFEIPRKIVKVTLDATDTYTLSVFSVRIGNKLVAITENVYADCLQAAFTSATGLYTKL